MSILPRSITLWKKQFLDNISLAFDKSTVVREYKEKIEVLEKEKNATSKKLGETIVERDFLEGKLKSSLSFNHRRNMIETEHTLSLNKQLKILSISKTGYYYKKIQPFSSSKDIEILNTIDSLYTNFPYYGAIRMSKALKREDFNIGKKKTRTIMKFMGLRALYPKVKTTKANREHKKYPYLLKSYKNNNNQVTVDTPNEVWSTDITYRNKGNLCLKA